MLSRDPDTASRKVIPVLACLSLASYVARTDISIAAKIMMPDLGLTQLQMGQVFSAFMLGYAIFQTPAGLAGDRLGPRTVLTFAAAAWSLFALLTGTLPGLLPVSAFLLLLAIRFLLGVSEAAMYPVAGRAVVAWVAAPSRSFANSVVVGGLAVGSAIAPPLVSWLMVHAGWRQAFFIVALLPLLCAAAWWRVAPPARTIPSADHASWWTLLKNRDIGVISVSYFFESYVQYIFLFWFFLYLVDVRGFTIARGGLLTSLPYICAMVSMPAVGHWSDRLTASFGSRIGRAGLVLALFAAAAICLLLGAQAANPYIAVALISLSVGLVLSTEGPFWASVTSIAGPHAGAAGGLMNTAGNLAGVASTALVPVLVKEAGWPFVFYSAAALCGIAGLLWLALRLPGPDLAQPSVPPHPLPEGEVL